MSNINAPFSNRTTSLDAARKMSKGAAQTQRDKVLKVLEDAGERGLTDWEIANAAEIGIRQASARRRSLVIDGLVADSEQTRKVKQTDYSSIVWVRRNCEPSVPKTRYEQYIEKAVRSEREACAKECEYISKQLSGILSVIAIRCATAIRNRDYLRSSSNKVWEMLRYDNQYAGSVEASSLKEAMVIAEKYLEEHGPLWLWNPASSRRYRVVSKTRNT